MLSDEEISALREKNAYPETNVQDIEPRATADTRIRARSPGSKGEFTHLSLAYCTKIITLLNYPLKINFKKIQSVFSVF
jgi:hypothetical protein